MAGGQRRTGGGSGGGGADVPGAVGSHASEGDLVAAMSCSFAHAKCCSVTSAHVPTCANAMRVVQNEEIVAGTGHTRLQELLYAYVLDLYLTFAELGQWENRSPAETLLAWPAYN
eukprot:1151959-Pelagomonas_calceolata.AAC.1